MGIPQSPILQKDHFTVQAWSMKFKLRWEFFFAQVQEYKMEVDTGTVKVDSCVSYQRLQHESLVYSFIYRGQSMHTANPMVVGDQRIAVYCFA